jgi:hypothetical protein
MELEQADDGFRAIDAAKNTVQIGTDGWDETADAPAVEDAISVDRPGSETDPDITVSGKTRGLRFPPVYIHLQRIDDDSRRKFDEDCSEMDISRGKYVLTLNSNLRVFIRFNGSGTLQRDGYDAIELSFDEPEAVSIRFHSTVGRPGEQITIGSTLEDVAEALPLLSSTIRNSNPDRTWPAVREQPPGIRLGESLSIPDSVKEEHVENDIDLLLPRDLDYLTTSASLVHYLGASITLEQGATPTLRLRDSQEPLGTLPEFQYNAASILRRVFYLDCLARVAGPHGARLSLSGHLPELGLDADWLYEASLAERTRAYLDAPFETVTEEFPEWNLSMYVDPSYEHVQTLPYLLENLPFIFLPESEELTKGEWISLSMDDSYEHGSTSLDAAREPAAKESFTRVQREISNVDLVKPVLGPSRYHGWLADDVPIDVFKTFLEAYENRQKYLDDSPISVVAVLNNANMREEHDAAVERYKQRAEELNIDMTVRENITSAELARTFESRNDLVHFIGHSDEQGLECSDGFLSISSVSESNTQTFFLNACGSYHEGVGLVRKGSVAGGVTFEAVTDKQAAEVGTTFSRLMVRGYSLERALNKARQQVMTPKDYAVVGDGTHVVTQSESIVPPHLRLAKDGEEEYSLRVSQNAPQAKGAQGQERFDDSNGDYHLNSQDRTYQMTRPQLLKNLDIVENPILFDNELYWPDSLRQEL